jgi:hypothetical protein
MKHQSQGNGSGKFEIGYHDMGGWVRICAGKQNLPEDLPVYLSKVLTEFFRKQPQLLLRCVVPIQRDGDTVELHAWYDSHVFPPPPAASPPEGQTPK